MFTNKFYEIFGNKMKQCSLSQIEKAKDIGLQYLTRNHLIMNTEQEYRQFIHFYSLISQNLNLGLLEEEIKTIAFDRTYNMNNYIAYPDIVNVIETLSKSFKLGIVSDTWPSIETQLENLGVGKFFSFGTFSCFLGIFKPDERMYLDALSKCGCKPEETVFIDDSLANLHGAARMGITPVLIAVNPASVVESPFMKIHSLSELLD